ncbi:MAG: hypothetical protein EB084_16465 [Proteobacteria bacterium]|nr:hypothetical protein [Pseudomonadota bacterium]
MNRRLVGALLVLLLVSLQLLIFLAQRRLPLSQPASPNRTTASATRMRAKAPPVTSKELRWAISPDLSTWKMLPYTVKGVGTPQMAWFEGHLVTFCSDPSRVQTISLEPGRGDKLTVGKPQNVGIEGETADKQVDPNVIALPGGGYRLFYTVSAGNEDPAYERTEFHSAVRRANRWVREPGCRLSDTGIVDPDVIALPDGTWRMFFTRGIEEQICSATSSNGLDFVIEPGQRVAGQVSATIHVGSTYLMAHQSLGGLFNQGLLHVLRSDDGLQFTPDPRFRWQESNVAVEGPNLIMLKDGRFLMAYITPQQR